MKKWINKDEWDFEILWRRWRESTIHLNPDSKEAKSHPLYKEVEEFQKRLG